jgi:hypothetical protein
MSLEEEACKVHPLAAMKIPAHILGLVVIGIAAPAVAGCAAEAEPSTPAPSTVETKLEESPEGEAARPSKPAEPTSAAPNVPKGAEAAANEPRGPGEHEPCPACGMG